MILPENDEMQSCGRPAHTANRAAERHKYRNDPIPRTGRSVVFRNRKGCCASPVVKEVDA